MRKGRGTKPYKDRPELVFVPVKAQDSDPVVAWHQRRWKERFVVTVIVSLSVVAAMKVVGLW